MFDSTRTVAVTLAILTVVGFGIAPMTAVASPSESTNTAYQLDGDQLDDGPSTQANSSGPVPEEVCTDLLGMLHEEAPYDMLVWVDDLPNDVQPPGVPWSVLTPKSIAGIVVGATPNQCDVFDPNDPPYDPIQDDDDEFAPDGGGDVQEGEDGEVLFIVNGTLDNTSDGPAVEGTAGLDLAENGTLDPDATLHDGEKKYALDPQLEYWSDGTTYFDTDVFVFGTRLGTVMDCTGPECTFSTRGLPTFVEYPSLPSHSDSDPDAGSGGDDGADSGGDSDDSGTDDGTGGTGTDGDSGGADGGDGSGSGDSGGADETTGTDDGTGGEAGSGGSGGSGDETGGDGSDGSDSSNDGQSGAGETGGDGDAGGQSGGDADSQQQASQNGDDGNQGAQQAAAADGSGLGVVVAMIVFILGAAAIAPRD